MMIIVLIAALMYVIDSKNMSIKFLIKSVLLVVNVYIVERKHLGGGVTLATLLC